MRLPKPTLDILNLMLENNGPMAPSQIQAKLTNYSAKDIKYALRRLRERKIIRQMANLSDMRRVYYRLLHGSEIQEVIAELSEEEVKVFTPLFTNNSLPSF